VSAARITVGLPVYKGADLVGEALSCLQRQTFGDFEAIISVDGNDAETAAACRPFLTDPRFRMVVHPERLDWVGNFNWLLQQELKEFFCYRQHDDTTAPEFFEVLLRVAGQEPDAAAIYCDCQLRGGRSDIEIVPSITGEPLDRLFQYVARLPNIGAPVPLRGLIRRDAIREAGLVRTDEFRAAWQVFGWLARLLRWGNFRRVPQPLYYRLDHARSYTRAHWDEAHKASWTTLFTGLLDAAMGLCRTPDERLFFQQAILDRMIAFPPLWGTHEYKSTEQLVSECLDRLKYERNDHLLDVKEFPSIIGELQSRVGEITRIERSRWRRGIWQIRQRHRLGKLIYSKSRMRRVIYQTLHLLELLQKTKRWLFFAFRTEPRHQSELLG
jgi:glycosyltransferase involved in cell wall biosynthesis